MICRAVPLDEEQYLLIEDLGKAYIRAGDQQTGTKLLAIALAWKVSPVVTFACEIDESAGLSNAIEIHGYSRKAPRA